MAHICSFCKALKVTWVRRIVYHKESRLSRTSYGVVRAEAVSK